MFSKLDAVNQQIIDVLLATDGIVSYQDLKKDQIIFSMPLTQLSTKILYPEPSYSLKSMLRDVKAMLVVEETSNFVNLVNIIAQNCLGFEKVRLKNGTLYPVIRVVSVLEYKSREGKISLSVKQLLCLFSLQLL